MEKKEVNFENRITVRFGKLKKVVNQLKKVHFQDDDLVTFEYLVGSCFPNVLKNIEEEIRLAYTQGYIAGSSAEEDMSINDIN